MDLKKVFCFVFEAIASDSAVGIFAADEIADTANQAGFCDNFVGLAIENGYRLTKSR